MNHQPKTHNQFVSRGGLKLQHALRNWSANRRIEVGNSIALDVGSSTGGFVDCLLQNGAKKVYAVDTAYGELAWKLRNNPQVSVLERTNILHLSSLPEQVDLVTIDAGWTKLEKVLPAIEPFLKPDAKIIALLKPHYQTSQKNLKKGVVPKELLEGIKSDVLKNIQQLGFSVLEEIESPIQGGGGNTEYLLLLSKNP